eukprot:gene10260-10419_t
MFKITRGLGHKASGKQALKYRFDVFVDKLDNLPGPVKRCRVVWSRGPKVQMTDIKEVTRGAAEFKQKLSQIATMYKDAKDGYEPKEYKFQVQVPGKSSSDKLITVGKAELDLSYYVLAEGKAQNKMVPMIFKVGAASTGYLKVVITAEQVTGPVEDDDGMTEVSGMTGVAHMNDDQDLSGFDESDELSKTSLSPSEAAATSSSKIKASRLAPMAKPKAAVEAATAGSPTSKAKPASAPSPVEDDGDVSPLDLSPTSSVSESAGRGPGKPSIVPDKNMAAAAAGKTLSKVKADLLSQTPLKGRSNSGGHSQPAHLTEDEARAELFSSKHSGRSGSRKASETRTTNTNNAAKAEATNGRAGLPSTEVAHPQASVSSATETTAASSTTGQGGPSAAATAVGGRRALLARTAPKDKDDALGGSGGIPPALARGSSSSGNNSSRKEAAGSIEQQPNTVLSVSKHGWSDAENEQLAAENEKLRAQVVALRDQAAQVEDGRRQARIAAESAASERDDYRAQVQELQDQLKEQVDDSNGVAAKAQEQMEVLAKQVKELTHQLADAQHVLQQHATAADTPPAAELEVVDVPAISNLVLDLRRKLKEQGDKKHQGLDADVHKMAQLVLLCLTAAARPVDQLGDSESAANDSNNEPTEHLMPEPDEHMLQLQNALVKALAELQRCAQLLDSKERDLKLLQEQGQQQVIALADSARTGPVGLMEALSTAQEQVADLQKQLAEAEVLRRGLDKDVTGLKKQLAEEQAERTTLEDHLAQHMEDAGDDMAQETVAAYEAKYNRLKTRYRQQSESHREEVDQLHDEIAALQERNVELEILTAQLEAAKSQAQHGEATLAETLQKSSKVSGELAAIRQENQSLMKELVAAKLELAQCSEREVIGRRELYKAKETNMKLASKMTKLETLVYNRK